MRLLQLGRPLVVTTLVAGLGALLSSGCAENRSSVYIVGVLAPDSSCTFEASFDTARQSVGTMCAGTRTYIGEILVANQLTKLGDASNLKTETNIFQIEGVEVNVLNADGSSAGAAYSASTSGTIQAANGGTPGLVAISVPLVDGATVKAGETILSEFRIFGSSLGGVSIETGWFRFPLIGVTCACNSAEEPEFCGTSFLGCTSI